MRKIPFDIPCCKAEAIPSNPELRGEIGQPLRDDVHLKGGTVSFYRNDDGSQSVKFDGRVFTELEWDYFIEKLQGVKNFLNEGLPNG